jgi:uncharacterized protein (TIGR03086 family)
MTSPTAPVAPTPTTDPRTSFFDAVRFVGPLVANVRIDQLDGSTPCSEMDVRHLVAHLVLVLDRVADLGDGLPFHPADPEVPDGHAAEIYEQSAARVTAVWSNAELLTALYTLPWAELPGFAVMGTYTNELIVHGWDLAVSTGQRPNWDDAPVAAALAAITIGLPADGPGRASSFEAMRDSLPPEYQGWSAPFGDVVPVPEDAPLIDRLAAWNGRTPC